MVNAYSRKKKPEIVRQALLDNAARVAVEHGFAAVTLQTVAQAANVTKGGLFHHFANKQALVEAMVHDQLDKFEAVIETRMSADKTRHGRFTRAYVSSIFDWRESGAGSTWGALASSATADRSLRVIWRNWTLRQLDRNRETDSGTELEFIRLAADGAWISYLMDEVSEETVLPLEKYLLGLTLPK